MCNDASVWRTTADGQELHYIIRFMMQLIRNSSLTLKSSGVLTDIHGKALRLLDAINYCFITALTAHKTVLDHKFHIQLSVIEC